MSGVRFPHLLLVFGGSQGARRLNESFAQAAAALVGAGVQVLHASGARQQVELPADLDPDVPYVVVPYLDRMDLAYAAADAVVCRAGASTVTEVACVGLPAVFVPLPHGNGEQALNAAPVVAAGGGVLVPDAELTGQRLLAELLPLLTDPDRLAAMGAAARASGHAEADDRLAEMFAACRARSRPAYSRMRKAFCLTRLSCPIIGSARLISRDAASQSV